MYLVNDSIDEFQKLKYLTCAEYLVKVDKFTKEVQHKLEQAQKRKHG